MLMVLPILASALTACSEVSPFPVRSPSPLATPMPSPLVIPPTPIFTSTTGAVSGHVQLPPEWKVARVYLAPFYPDETGKNGFYLLEPSVHRSADMALDGYFQVAEVTPGQYVIVIGPSPEDSRAIADANGQPQVFTVVAGQHLGIGEARLLTQ
jgi:hypothetical protein